MPMRYAWAPASAAPAARACEFASTTWPGWLARPASTSSSPVAITETRGLGRTTTWPTPVAASTATSAGVTYAPAGAMTVPALISSPGPPHAQAAFGLLTHLDRGHALVGHARAGSRRRPPPAAERRRRPRSRCPARPGPDATMTALTSPTTLSRTGRWGAAPMHVLPAGGVAVGGGVVERGQRCGRAYVLGEHVAEGLGEVQVQRGQRPQSLQDT